MILVLTTVPEEKAEKVKKKVLEKKLAGCVLEINVKSMYWWKNGIESDREVLLVIKSTEGLKERLLREIESMHPYEVPFIAVLGAEVNPSYMKWLESVVNG